MKLKVAPELFLTKPWRVHSLLKGVPLLDVWQMHLQSRESGHTLEDLLRLAETSQPTDLHPATRFLFWLREQIGKVARWDSPLSDEIPPHSFVNRLTATDQQYSLETPGTVKGPVRLIYRFKNEVLLEIVNATTHAFMHISMEPSEMGYRAYIAVYAKNRKWWSKFYMALIDPFRHWIVYPSLLRAAQRRWQEVYGHGETRVNVRSQNPSH